MPNIKDRLLIFLEHLGIGQSKFEKITGLSNGLINNISDNISTKSVIKIAKVYRELNIMWLLTGEEPMINVLGKSSFDIEQDVADFFSAEKTTLIALKAAMKVITKKLIEADIKETNRPEKAVRLEFDKAMKEEYNQLLDELKLQS